MTKIQKFILKKNMQSEEKLEDITRECKMLHRNEDNFVLLFQEIPEIYVKVL